MSSKLIQREGARCDILAIVDRIADDNLNRAGIVGGRNS
jgi:hypothetical protein